MLTECFPMFFQYLQIFWVFHKVVKLSRIAFMVIKLLQHTFGGIKVKYCPVFAEIRVGKLNFRN